MDKQKESEIIDVFGRYADEVLSITGIYESRTNAIKFDNLKKAIDSGDLLLPPKNEGEKYYWLMTNIMLLSNEERHNLTMALIERDGIKDIIERAKLEAKIELLKNTADFLNDTCPYGKFLPLYYVESEITEYEKKLQEMK